MQNVARRERRLLIGAGAAVTVLAWWLLGLAAFDRAGWAGSLLHVHHEAATFQTFVVVVAMWQAMMIAMMTPVVLRWVIVLGALLSDADPRRRVTPVIVAFAGGYFVIWLAYSVIAGSAQLALQRAGLIDLRHGTGSMLAGLLLASAGLFQLSPLKRACLAHCRSPLGYFLRRWRNGPAGGFRLGLGHGLYCAACCWAMMAAALAVGVMNLFWMAALTIVLCIEQTARHGHRIGRAVGWAMAIWGCVLIVHG